MTFYTTFEFLLLRIFFYTTQVGIHGTTWLFYTFVVDPIEQHGANYWLAFLVTINMLAFPYIVLSAAIYTLPRGHRRPAYQRQSRCYVHRSRLTLRKSYLTIIRFRRHSCIFPRPRPLHTSPTTSTRSIHSAKSTRRRLQRLHNIIRRHSFNLRSRGRHISFVTSAARANDSGLTLDDSRSNHDVSTELHYFDAYDSYLDTDFFDAVSMIPDRFYACYEGATAYVHTDFERP